MSCLICILITFKRNRNGNFVQRRENSPKVQARGTKEKNKRTRFEKMANLRRYSINVGDSLTRQEVQIFEQKKLKKSKFIVSSIYFSFRYLPFVYLIFYQLRSNPSFADAYIRNLVFGCLHTNTNVNHFFSSSRQWVYRDVHVDVIVCLI